ncbi:hypothetical protein RZS08_15635, partial [Arthrospira platensis SPKY1]|nr:hypothetical protein [Arthrospira platensis SPKY1]
RIRIHRRRAPARLRRTRRRQIHLQHKIPHAHGLHEPRARQHHLRADLPAACGLRPAAGCDRLGAAAVERGAAGGGGRARGLQPHIQHQRRRSKRLRLAPGSELAAGVAGDGGRSAGLRRAGGEQVQLGGERGIARCRGRPGAGEQQRGGEAGRRGGLGESRGADRDVGHQ